MTGKESPGCLGKQLALPSRLLISNIPEKELISDGEIITQYASAD